MSAITQNWKKSKLPLGQKYNLATDEICSREDIVKPHYNDYYKQSISGHWNNPEHFVDFVPTKTEKAILNGDYVAP